MAINFLSQSYHENNKTFRTSSFVALLPNIADSVLNLLIALIILFLFLPLMTC